MISFANPSFLWGFAALALPIAIHLLSRKEGKVIYIGSLRHLQESNTRQSLNIRLNELLLLLMRTIVIALLVLFISGFRWQIQSGSQKKWLFLEKGLERNEKLKPTLDSLQRDGYEAHYLSPGFPLLEDSVDVQSFSTYWELTKPLQSLALTKGFVFSLNRVELFRGHRPALPQGIQWIVCDVTSHKFPVQSLRMKDNTVKVRTGYSNEASTYFETGNISHVTGNYFKFAGNSQDSVELINADTLSILFISDELFSRDVKVLRAAIASLQGAIPQTQLLIDTKPVLKSYDWIFQFKPGMLSAPATDHKVIFREQPSSPLFVQSNLNEWQLTRRLTEGTALKENLSIQLSRILFPAKKTWSIASLNDMRSMEEAMAWAHDAAPSTTSSQAALFSEHADGILMLLILTVILIERIVSNHRKQ